MSFRIKMFLICLTALDMIGGRKKFSSLLVLLAAAMLIGLSGLYSWAMIESVPAALNMLIPLSICRSLAIFS